MSYDCVSSVNVSVLTREELFVQLVLIVDRDALLLQVCR